MGLNSKGYYTLKDIFKEKAQIMWLYSERGDGKSYAVKEFALKRAIKEEQPTMAIIRRNDVDIKPSKINKYFIERREKDNLIKKITNNEWTHTYCRNGYIYLARFNERGKEEKSSFPIGEYFALTTATHEKSTGHKCKDIICEEMLTEGIYLEDEPSKLMHLISTITRSDDVDVNIFLIGNTLNRICPYFKEWGMTNIFKQEQGTIDTYYYTQSNGKKVKICCERIKSREEKSGIFIGKAEKSIQGGEWQVQEYPKLYKKLEEFEEIDSITYISSNNTSFTIRLIIDENGNKFCFVHPAKHISDRVLTSDFSINPLHSPRLSKNKSIDISIHNCFYNNKVMYSDNLTATDFWNSIKAEKINPLN